jgi:hypothetical protein
MATKLRDLQLTSVDLVRAGANQEADICLFKSLDGDPHENTPTEPPKAVSKSDPDRYVCIVEVFP